MDERQFAEFFIQRGYRVVSTASASWVEIHPLCFQNLLYYRAINPTKEELKTLFFRNFAIIVRFMTLDSHEGLPAYLWVCSQKDYDFHRLEINSRSKTRRGLKRTTISKLSFAYLAEHGLPLVKETALRQERNPDFSSRHEWLKFCKSADQIPDFETWGAFVDDHLAAFLVGAHLDEYYHIFYQYSKAEYLKYYPNNALVYTVTKNKIENPEVSMVSYGLDSVENTPGLRKFKSHMGYEIKQLHQKILVNPLVPWIKNQKIKLIINKLLEIRPRNNYLRKAQAILNLLTP